jgi:hypothetical protein
MTGKSNDMFQTLRTGIQYDLGRSRVLLQDGRVLTATFPIAACGTLGKWGCLAEQHNSSEDASCKGSCVY